MVLVSEDQFQVVVTFFLFIAAHVEIGKCASVDGPFAFFSPVVCYGAGDFEAAFVVQGGDPFLSGSHDVDPVFVNFDYFGFWDAGGFPPLLLLET